MGISIKTAFKNNLIQNELFKGLPHTCKCGSSLEFSDSLRELRCTNKKCKYYLVNRTRAFAEKANIEIEDNDIENLIDILNLTTPYQLIMIGNAIKDSKEKVKNIQLHNKEKFLQSIEKINNREYLLYEIIELCGIDNITKVAYKIFSGFDSIDEAYNEIDNGQVAFINERLGIKNQDSTILSYEIYNKLIEMKEEFMFAESQFNIHVDDKEKLNVAINDNILPYTNVGELMEWLNYTYPYRFNLVTTISNTTDILVKNADICTAKFRIARLINDKYVAELMNSGQLELVDIGVFKNNELKPKGSKVYIDTLDNIINRLNKISG